ncbi:thioredoxin family protein [Pontiella sp.]|uniref:thioredoxin family protein n=1 Tax=Pontiella sp. TaxID=2837462 RepID=UPI0035695F30
MKKNIMIVGLLVVAVVAVVGIKNKKTAGAEAIGCESGMCTLPFPQEKMMPEGVEVKAPAEKPLPKLLDLGAGKCIPCKMMAPILDEMKETFAGQLDVEFIDVWEDQSVGAKYGIRMIPTQIFYDAAGKELFRHEGFFAREDMLAKWQELGYGFAEPQINE